MFYFESKQKISKYFHFVFVCFKKCSIFATLLEKRQWQKLIYIFSYSVLLFSCKTSRSEFGM